MNYLNQEISKGQMETLSNGRNCEEQLELNCRDNSRTGIYS